MAQEPTINIWPGSSKFTAGKTPFGYYDADSAFIVDADKVANWCARRLGYPVVDVELIDINFYAAFEESIMEYGNFVHTYAAMDNIIDLKGSTIGDLNLSGNYITPTMNGVFKLAKKYGAESPGGGNKVWYQGKLKIRAGEQVYTLTDPNDTEIESGDVEMDSFTIKKLYHFPVPAGKRVSGLNLNMQTIVNEFGFGVTTPNYLLIPLNYDVQMMQAIEMNREIRKSQYGFKLTGNRIRIFPIPETDGFIYFDYTLDEEQFNNTDQSEELISDISNIPYQNIKYSKINSIGKGWIKRYTLALCKEMLGMIRGKYSSLPIPETEITLNADALLSQAQAEKEELITELKEILDKFTSSEQMKRKQEEAEALATHLNGVPMKIYIR